MAEGYEVAAVEEVSDSIKPIKVQKGRSTGTAELKAVARSLETISDLVEKVVEEVGKDRYDRTFTEKCGKEIITATDVTLLKLLGDLTDKAAKISGTKHRMSSGDYTPTATVVAKGQRTVDMVSNLLKEHLGPVAGQAVVNQFIEELVEVWNE